MDEGEEGTEMTNEEKVRNAGKYDNMKKRHGELV